MMAFVLALSVAALCGVLLASAIWAGGAGWLALLPGVERPNAVCAYPLGLLGVTAVAFAWLVHPLAGAAVALVYAAPALRARREVARLARVVARPVALVLPLGLAFGGVLGVYDRGPSATRDSHVFGDIVWWASHAASAGRSPTHLPDLSTVGYTLPLVESAAGFLDGALQGLVGDPFLAYATALPVCMLVSFAIGLRLLAGSARRPDAVVALGLLLVGASIYPSWLAESPPVALVAPLALAVVALARERVGLAAFVLLSAAIGIDVVETKIIATASLAPVLLWALAHHHRGRLRGNAIALAVGAALALALGAAVLVATASWTLHTGLGAGFEPAHVPGHLLDFERRHDLASLGLPAIVAGEMLLLAQALRARAGAALVGLVCGVLASWVVLGQNFAIGARCALVVAAVALVVDREPDALGARLLLAAGGCVALAAVAADTAELPTSAPLGALLAGALCVAARAALGAGRRSLVVPALVAASVAAVALAGHGVPALALGVLALGAVAARPPRRLALGAALVVALAAGATLTVAATRHEARLGVYDTTVLPREEYQVWRRVHEVVPADALVFTTLTGWTMTPTTGWNYYPALGGRQVFIAGWVYSQIGVDIEVRRRRLHDNLRIFSGAAAPDGIPSARGFPAYYAVMWTDQPHPRSFREVYANRLFVLYRVPAQVHARVLVTRYACPTYDTCTRLPRARVVTG
jgi:hypothetical protein